MQSVFCAFTHPRTGCSGSLSGRSAWQSVDKRHRGRTADHARWLTPHEGLEETSMWNWCNARHDTDIKWSIGHFIINVQYVGRLEDTMWEETRAWHGECKFLGFKLIGSFQIQKPTLDNSSTDIINVLLMLLMVCSESLRNDILNYERNAKSFLLCCCCLFVFNLGPVRTKVSYSQNSLEMV